ncbi:hypothetical protein EVG20_g2098 [Dentipellis fragilis]|uniref:CSC1/OSCA1-like 7TM region domain-containing protein n=1 Tax=Dentipellis fragilis TaxID=205917 RepID=A0A4Y9Z8Z1_9AGAM|nr:hypothetical protein EVG20_g2098 [Dentipellis fragilis]
MIIPTTTNETGHSAQAINDDPPNDTDTPVFHEAESTMTALHDLRTSSIPPSDLSSLFTTPTPGPYLTSSSPGHGDSVRTRADISSSNTTFPAISREHYLPTIRAPVDLSVLEQSVCIGNGIDASADGILSTLVLSSVVGLICWVTFGVLRPRFRQVYGLREWFVQQEVRPKPLQPSFWAFLSPPVPLVPSVPTDVADAGKSPAADAHLFPSDEELSQRILWVLLTIVLGWSVVGLGTGLPIYLVATPCLAKSSITPQFSDDRDIATTQATDARAILNGTNVFWRTRIRVIILIVVLIVVGILPALWRILNEFNKLVLFRRRWVDIHLEGQEMGWLSLRQAPGLAGMGEKEIKEFVAKAGLSSMRGEDSRRQHPDADVTYPADEGDVEIDIKGLFSIGETNQLASLIEQRDDVLNNLEIAETRYISSFRLSTPDPSIADLITAPATETEGLPHISRPRALSGSQTTHRRRRRRHTPYTSSSTAPTSYVAPSQYYQLGSLKAVNGGRFTDEESGTSFTDSVTQRVVGTRFQEVNRNSKIYGRLPIGSHVQLQHGVFTPVPASVPSESIPDPRRYGPNYVTAASDAEPEFDPAHLYSEHAGEEHASQEQFAEDWVDVMHEPPIDFSHAETPPLLTSPELGADTTEDTSYFSWGRRPKIFGPSPSELRETFPLRGRHTESTGSDVAPPHLRLQSQPPFVRPMTGFDHDGLGAVYADIRTWRTQLKSINQEIADAQQDAYADIADGSRILGWLLVGRGLRFIPGVQLIEGRAKDDIRWDELQNEGGQLNKIAFGTVAAMTAILLGIGLTAAVGLALADAPDFSHYLTFLQRMSNHNGFTNGLATVLAPAAASALFIACAVGLVHYFSRMLGNVSISATRLTLFKTIFYLLLFVSTVWLVAVAAVLYAFGALSTSSRRSQTVADGSIYISQLVLAIVLIVAVTAPALLLLQPIHLWRVRRAEKVAVTPRQRFRAVYPGAHNATFALGCCVLAFIYASCFSFIFPLIAPAAAVLLSLTLIAHRFLVGYVYGRTSAPTGGLLQLWLLKRTGSVLALQPLLLGLILLSRRLWPEGGALIGIAVLLVLFVEGYTTVKTRQPSRQSLSIVTQHSLDTFAKKARPVGNRSIMEGSPSVISSARATRARGSLASVLEMMSATLAVMPSPSQLRGPVPIHHAEEMAGILYAPELTAPQPIIWLPNDSAGVARSEAYDLQRYHELRATLDVHATEDVLAQRPSSSRASRARRTP